MVTMTNPELQPIVEAIRARRRFVISSHARPDGDSIGSSLAMAYALQALGKEADVVHSDPAPGPLMLTNGMTWMPVCVAVRAALFLSAAVMDWLVPSVPSVALNCPTPLLSVVSPGSTALGSLLVKWTVPR